MKIHGFELYYTNLLVKCKWEWRKNYWNFSGIMQQQKKSFFERFSVAFSKPQLWEKCRELSILLPHGTPNELHGKNLNISYNKYRVEARTCVEGSNVKPTNNGRHEHFIEVCSNSVIFAPITSMYLFWSHPNKKKKKKKKQKWNFVSNMVRKFIFYCCLDKSFTFKSTKAMIITFHMNRFIQIWAFGS